MFELMQAVASVQHSMFSVPQGREAHLPVAMLQERFVLAVPGLQMLPAQQFWPEAPHDWQVQEEPDTTMFAPGSQ